MVDNLRQTIKHFSVKAMAVPETGVYTNTKAVWFNRTDTRSSVPRNVGLEIVLCHIFVAGAVQA